MADIREDSDGHLGREPVYATIVSTLYRTGVPPSFVIRREADAKSTLSRRFSTRAGTGADSPRFVTPTRFLPQRNRTFPLTPVSTLRRPIHPFRAFGLATLATLVLAASAVASSSYSRFYVDQLYLGNGIEEQGLSYQGRTVAIDNAYCIGLRRFGVQTSAYGLDKFWRFKCTMNAANGHAYESQISVTHSPKPTYVYWHYLTVRRIY